jgi:hypothetical protein
MSSSKSGVISSKLYCARRSGKSLHLHQRYRARKPERAERQQLGRLGRPWSGQGVRTVHEASAIIGACINCIAPRRMSATVALIVIGASNALVVEHRKLARVCRTVVGGATDGLERSRRHSSGGTDR